MQKRATVLAAIAAASIIATGCSGTATTPPASAPASGGGGSAFDPTKLDSAFTQMASLSSVYRGRPRPGRRHPARHDHVGPLHGL